MFSKEIETSGWLKKYIFYRLKFPFSLEKLYHEMKLDYLNNEKFDNFLYSVVRENGIFFGCPIISSSLTKLTKKLNFPPKKGGSVIIFLETLFYTAMAESILLDKKCFEDYKNYETTFLKIIFSVIEYYLPNSFFKIPRDTDVKTLLKNNETMTRALKKLEKVFLDSITLKGYSSLGNRQNIFTFLKIYFFLLWVRENSKNPEISPYSYHILDSKLREEMTIIFASLIWANNFFNKKERLVLEKYIEQTGLPKKKQIELKKKIYSPVSFEEIVCNFNSLVIKNYIIEQLILLSLILDQNAREEIKIIQEISSKLSISKRKLEQLLYSVAEFFTKNRTRLEFLRKNRNIQEFQDYMNDMVVSLVRNNLKKIINEIKETKELSELLVKSTTKKLTKQEKQKIKDQLLDIARSIPALAIFALPGGGILLPVILKVLPFKILPSSFQLDSDSKHAKKDE